LPETGEEVTVPDGVAHFLEHKMFEQPNGTNSLDTMMALGLDANAYTTNDHTAYLFECSEDENFYKGLDELMDYVAVLSFKSAKISFSFKFSILKPDTNTSILQFDIKFWY
jgi:predicted Zn-dependent peptidase